MITIASTIRKGGSGKTTLAVHLAHGLCMLGKRVLLVDLDSQGHCAMCLGAERNTAATMLVREDDPLTSLMIEVRPRLSLIASDDTLALAEAYLGRLAPSKREERVRSRLAAVAGDFDFCVLDVGPTLSALFVSAVACADHILIPVLCEFLPTGSVADTLATLGKCDCQGKVRYVVPMRYDSRITHCRNTLQSLNQFFGEEKVAFPIPTSSALADSPSAGQTLFEYAPEHKAAAALLELVDKCVALQDPSTAAQQGGER